MSLLGRGQGDLRKGSSGASEPSTRIKSEGEHQPAHKMPSHAFVIIAGFKDHVADGEISPPPSPKKKNLLLILSSEQMEEQNCTVSELSTLVGDTFIKQYKTLQM